MMADALAVTYRIRGIGLIDDVDVLARDLAVLESTGQWLRSEIPPDWFANRMGTGYVTGRDDDAIEVRYELPVENLGAGGYTDLFMAAASGYTPALAGIGDVEWIGIECPDSLLETMPGPQWGVQRLRQRIGRANDELLIGTIVKPVGGIPPEMVAEDCYQAALGGVDFIKDDQKMLNPDYCPLEARVAAVDQSLNKAEQMTGQRRPLYAPNVTARPDKIVEQASRAVEAGAEAVMFGFVATGFPTLELVAEIGPDVPIYAHCGGKELLTRGHGHGMSVAVHSLLARLCGADMLRVSAVGGDLVHSDSGAVADTVDALSGNINGIAPTMPAISGGLGPSNLWQSLEVCGMENVMVLAGRGVTKHPDGVSAGVTALRQAADAFRVGVRPEEHAASAPELARALSIGL